MNRIIIFIFIPFIYFNAQTYISADMGLLIFNSSSFTDYINFSYATDDNRLQTFNTSAEFSGSVEFVINEHLKGGFEYGLQLFSFNTSSYKVGFYDISYNINKPSITAYYLISGKGYEFNIGGGAGIRVLSVSEEINDGLNIVDYSSVGWGIFMKIKGLTQLSNNLYAVISVAAGYDINGEPENKGMKIIDNSVNESVNFNSIYSAFKLGLSYKF